LVQERSGSLIKKKGNGRLASVFINNFLEMAIFITGELITGLAVNYFTNSLEHKGWRATVFILFAILCMAVMFWLFKRWMQRSRRKSWIESKNSEPAMGLIAAVSIGDKETPAETAIKFHASALRYCWLLVSRQADANFQKIYQRYSQYDPGDPAQRPRYQNDDGHYIQIYKREISDPYDIDSVYKVMKGIYREAAEFGIKEQDIVCDYTGATASVSAAMTLVTAVSENRNLQYLVPNRIDQNGRAIIEAGSTPLLIDFVMPGE